MLLQIHDELVFEAPDEEIAGLAELVRREMTGALDLSVPLEGRPGRRAQLAGCRAAPGQPGRLIPAPRTPSVSKRAIRAVWSKILDWPLDADCSILQIPPAGSIVWVTSAPHRCEWLRSGAFRRPSTTHMASFVRFTRVKLAVFCQSDRIGFVCSNFISPMLAKCLPYWQMASFAHFSDRPVDPPKTACKLASKWGHSRSLE